MNIENTTLHREVDGLALDRLRQRRRSDGVLTPRQIEICRGQGIALAFDPLQLGWILRDAEDDLAPAQPAKPRLAFREWAQDDAPRLAAMLSSEMLWRYLPERYTGPIDIQAAEALIELSRADHHRVRAVTKNGVPIGQVRLLPAEAQGAEVSYWLGQEHWGNGYASEMVTAFCEECLRECPEIRRLFARVHRSNMASQRVLRKARLHPVAEEGDWLMFERLRMPVSAS